MNAIVKSMGYREGRWRNGLGVSWDIAHGGSAEDFDWRMALARLDANVPFSAYPAVDRVFTLIEGDGLFLDVAGLGALEARKYQPVHFPGDVSTSCRLHQGPCRALNLFVKRGLYAPEVTVTCHGKGDEFRLEPSTLLFVAKGETALDGVDVVGEDSVMVNEADTLKVFSDSVIWRAILRPKDSRA